MQPTTCQKAAGGDLSGLVASEDIVRADFSLWTPMSQQQSEKGFHDFEKLGREIMSPYIDLETAKGGSSMNLSLSLGLESCFNLS